MTFAELKEQIDQMDATQLKQEIYVIYNYDEVVDLELVSTAEGVCFFVPELFRGE